MPSPSMRDLLELLFGWAFKFMGGHAEGGVFPDSVAVKGKQFDLLRLCRFRQDADSAAGFRIAVVYPLNQGRSDPDSRFLTA